MSIGTPRAGIYRCNLLNLALKLGVKPYNIPKILYGLQHSSDDDIAYDLDNESFILEFMRIPHQTHIFQLSEGMLKATREIERNMISKLNCMYFASRKVSLPTIEKMLKNEVQSEDPEAMYIDFSKKLNNLINLYFQARKGGKLFIKP